MAYVATLGYPRNQSQLTIPTKSSPTSTQPPTKNFHKLIDEKKIPKNKINFSSILLKNKKHNISSSKFQEGRPRKFVCKENEEKFTAEFNIDKRKLLTYDRKKMIFFLCGSFCSV
jgi:hypothetical protein